MNRICTSNIRIQGFHIDVYGHVNNARYLEFLEIARWEFIEQFLDKQIAIDRNWQFVVIHVDIHYRKPLYFNDLIQIETKVKEIGSVKTTMEQHILSTSQNAIAATAFVKFVLVNGNTGRPLRLQGDPLLYLQTGKIS